jgi:TatD DNase family protein
MTTLSSKFFIDIHSHQEIPQDFVGLASIDTKDFNPAHAPAAYYSLGLHPWFIAQQDCDEALKKLAAAAITDSNLLAVGECGLDRLIATPLSLQESIFRAQIKLAEEYSKPIIIHCARAFNDLLRIKNSEKVTVPWLIHGFNNNDHIARQCLGQDCYFSFGKAILMERSNARIVLQTMALDRVFLETDDADISISDIYNAAAKILSVDLAFLKTHIQNNFIRVFIHD